MMMTEDESYCFTSSSRTRASFVLTPQPAGMIPMHPPDFPHGQALSFLSHSHHTQKETGTRGPHITCQHHQVTWLRVLSCLPQEGRECSVSGIFIKSQQKELLLRWRKASSVARTECFSRLQALPMRFHSFQM